MVHRSGIKTAPPSLVCVLLLLVAHAYLVSVTHFHRPEDAGARTLGHARAVTDAGDADSSNSTVNHAQCLSCRVQRNLISDLHNSTPVFAAPLPNAADLRLHSPESYTDEIFPARAGRAPPPLL